MEYKYYPAHGNITQGYNTLQEALDATLGGVEVRVSMGKREEVLCYLESTDNMERAKRRAIREGKNANNV